MSEDIICPQPRIGVQWDAQGGIYAGVMRGQNGEPDYHLIIGHQAPERLTWDAAIKWANELEVDGHRDFTLPNRSDAAVARANARECFEDTWYWLSEEHASDGNLAWYQYFINGSQGYNFKDSNGRVCAVRRLTME